MASVTGASSFEIHSFETHIWHVVEKNTAKVAEILDRTDGMFVF